MGEVRFGVITRGKQFQMATSALDMEAGEMPVPIIPRMDSSAIVYGAGDGGQGGRK
jgi:hypothetical protein